MKKHILQFLNYTYCKLHAKKVVGEGSGPDLQADWLVKSSLVLPPHSESANLPLRVLRSLSTDT